MKILIVEDDAFVRESMRKFLQSHGYDVRIASDGLSAWRILRGDRGIDFLIIDWGLPDMSGIELVKKVRNIKNRDFHVLFVTANGGSNNLSMAIQSGADDFIRKPYDIIELLARVVAGERLVSALKKSRELTKIANRASNRVRRQNKVLEFKSGRDHDTGLYSKQGIGVFLSKFTLLERRSQDLGLMVIDVDRFKFINDTHGHHTGDVILRSVAREIKGIVSSHALVARWGGDEFLVVSLGNASGMNSLATRITDTISRKTFSKFKIPVSVTVGIALGKTLDFRKVFLEADRNMLQKKKNKKVTRD